MEHREESYDSSGFRRIDRDLSVWNKACEERFRRLERPRTIRDRDITCRRLGADLRPTPGPSPPR